MGYAISNSSTASQSLPYDIGEEGAKFQADSLFVSCGPDRPVISRGESIQLKASATTFEGKPFGSKLTYGWSVNTGRIEDEAAETRWDLKDTKPGNYVVTVRVTSASTEPVECSLQIVVESSERDKDTHPNDIRALRETGGSFLLPKQQERKGYNLYSYLLLGGPPSDNSRERYRETIEAYLALLPDITRLEKHFPPSELNITYLPVDAVPPGTTDIKSLAQWMLDHYDYPRARFLLRQITGDNREGPYIVSVPAPLSGPTPVSHYLWQDLSAVPAQFIRSWIKEFMNQAAQESFWEARSLPLLRLRIRSAIAVLAMALPDVQNSLDSYIKMGQSIPLQ